MKTHARMLWRDVWHLRSQVIAAALVTACGVAAFLSMRATCESLQSARDDYYRAFRFADVFARLKRAPAGLATTIAWIDGVAEARARIVIEVAIDVPGLDEPAAGRLVSIPERPAPMLNDLALRAGRYVQPHSGDEVIVSEAFAVANGLSPGDSLAAVINGRWRRLSIVGVALSPEYIYEVGPGALFPDNRRFGVMWMGEEELAGAYDMEGAFNDIVLRLTPGASEADVIERLDRLLARYGGLGAQGRADQLSHRFISDEIAQNRITSTFVPGIFLGVAAFLLHIVLSRLTAIQRGEIGLLKAFGYTNRQVGLHYLKLALATVGIGLASGGALGVVTDRWLTALYRDYYRFPHLDLTVSPRVWSLTLLIAVSAAALGALGAVLGAVRLPPAVAMRPQPPASFRAGFFEHVGLTSRLSSSTRMIVRSIARRPVKSILTAVGIACAIGILVVGRFGLDAMKYMMRVQFQVVRRDDATVIFNQPESGEVRHALARLPGVLAVEPFRAVPALLRYEHRSKRVEITGLPADAELHQLVDASLRPARLPEEGVLLTRKLGELLRVAPGRSLAIEVLEGSRPTLTVQVAGLVDEPIGIGAYMDLRALNRLMREERSISGACLKTDPLQSRSLYGELKRMPSIAGVAFRDAALRSFDQILDRSMRQVTWIEIIFACVIAFGVVYNGARIQLSERGNELASLRVLGFTRREVTWLLLGEQGLLTLMAVPLGLALGAWIAFVLVRRLDTELYRIPLVLDGGTFAFSVLVVTIAAMVSGLLVARRIDRLDLVAVLKTRE